MVITQCDECKAVFKVKEGFVGKLVRCKRCGANFYVKERTPPTAESAPIIPEVVKPGKVKVTQTRATHEVAKPFGLGFSLMAGMVLGGVGAFVVVVISVIYILAVLGSASTPDTVTASRSNQPDMSADYRPSLADTDFELPEPAPDSYDAGIELPRIKDVAMKVLPINDGKRFSQVTWKVEVHNPSSYDLELRIEAQFLDAEGFELLDDTIYDAFISAGETKSFSEKDGFVESAKANRIETIRARLVPK